MTQTIEQSLSQFDRLPPYNIEAEQCAIASMMLATDKTSRELILSASRPEMFYQPDHRILAELIQKLHKSGAAIDTILIRAELQKRKMLDEVGGFPYLSTILEKVPSAAHGVYYGGIVREKWILREAISAANSVISSAYDERSEGSEVVGRAAIKFTELSMGHAVQEFTKLSDAVEDAISELTEQKARYITTGLRDLDRAIGGIGLGMFTLVGGRPGAGKSQLCKQILRNIAAGGTPVGLVTVEEQERKVAENAIAAAAEVDNYKIAYNRLEDDDWRQIYATIGKHEIPLWIADKPTHIDDVCGAVTRLALEKKCKVVAVDYLQLIGTNGENENSRLTEISHALKNTFKRLEIGSIVCVQLNRANEMGGVRRPRLSDLRGSGTIEQDGDVILLLHREDYYHKNDVNYHPDFKLEIDVAKSKNGPSGAMPTKFSGAHQTVTDWNELDEVLI